MIDIDAIKSFKITTDKGTYLFYTNFDDIDKEKEISLFFDDMSIYHGYLVCIDDEEIILRNSLNLSIGLPFDRCLGWCLYNNIDNE